MKNIFLNAYQQMNESQQDKVGRDAGKLPWQQTVQSQQQLDDQALQPTGHQQLDDSQQQLDKSNWTQKDGVLRYDHAKRADESEKFKKDVADALTNEFNGVFKFKYQPDLGQKELDEDMVWDSKLTTAGMLGTITVSVSRGKTARIAMAYEVAGKKYLDYEEEFPGEDIQQVDFIIKTIKQVLADEAKNANSQEVQQLQKMAQGQVIDQAIGNSDKILGELNVLTEDSGNRWTLKPGGSDTQYTMTLRLGAPESKLELYVLVVPTQIDVDVYMYNKSIWHTTVPADGSAVNINDPVSIANAVFEVLADV